MQIEEFFTREEHNLGAEVEIRDKRGNPSECFLTVVGADSDIWRDVNRVMQRDALLASFADNDVRSQAEIRAGHLCKCVISWRGFTDKEGNPAPFDRERVCLAFIEAPYVTDLVDRFIADRGNFTKPPASK